LVFCGLWTLNGAGQALVAIPSSTIILLARLTRGNGSDYLYNVRVVLSLIVALALGWSSIVDNPAVCADDLGGPLTSSRPCSDEGAPAVPCVSCPCHLPSLQMATNLSVEPRVAVKTTLAVWPEQFVHATELVAPPTPPPLA
jgi:hypothetical protein